ncbi:MAG: transposase, partial [Candidatus Hydrothermarchaeota archaeon]
LTDPSSRAMVNNQRIEVCYNVQFTVDSNKLILDYEVTNDIKDGEHLSEMGKRAKQILEVEEIEVLADKGYYNSEEIKECVDNGITPYIPEPERTVSKEIDIPKPEFYKGKFQYKEDKDVYVCPEGKELTYRNTAVHHRKKMRIYKSRECLDCPKMKFCTRNKNGRIIYRWEHEEVLEEMRERVRREKEKVKLRNLLTEHIFGTMKRNFNQGYFLMRGIDKVGGEMALTVLAYNIRRVLNIIDPDRLIAIMRVTSKRIFNNLEDIFTNLRHILLKFRDLSFWWLKTTYSEGVYT